MKLSDESSFLIDKTLKGLVKRYANKGENAITDIYFQPLTQSGELVVFNDDDEILSRVIIQEWEGADVQVIENTLSKLLHARQKEFEALSIMKPFSFVLVDEDKETISDILLVDEDLVIASDTLLKGLDKELDDFLKHLLND
ncbi:MAG: hypothetical protein KBT15_09665 [Bacteroidales bacterium]|nr:hypothetical protein [Candidatus Minthousia equi]MDO4956020.1 hypothetical protein [Bacteroidales bacterium]